MSLSQNLRRLRSVWLILLLATMAVFALASCGGATSTPASPTKVATSQSTPTEAATSQSMPTAETSSKPTSTPTVPTTSMPVVQIKIVEKDGKYLFDPATVTIAKGTKVVWTNDSDASHTVVSDTNAFSGSAAFEQNKTFEMVFNTLGTFAYHCSIHPSMKATIIVTAGGAS